LYALDDGTHPIAQVLPYAMWILRGKAEGDMGREEGERIAYEVHEQLVTQKRAILRRRAISKVGASSGKRN
jgi:hypothetical protein